MFRVFSITCIMKYFFFLKEAERIFRDHSFHVCYRWGTEVRRGKRETPRSDVLRSSSLAGVASDSDRDICHNSSSSNTTVGGKATEVTD